MNLSAHHTFSAPHTLSANKAKKKRSNSWTFNLTEAKPHTPHAIPRLPTAIPKTLPPRGPHDNDRRNPAAVAPSSDDTILHSNDTPGPYIGPKPCCKPCKPAAREHISPCSQAKHSNGLPINLPNPPPRPSSYISSKERFMCPITGCKNFGGRGYARSTFIRHINNAHQHIMLSDETERTKALNATITMGEYGCCQLCGKLNLEANGQPFCKKCSKLNATFATVKSTLASAEQNRIADRIKVANQKNASL